MQEIGGEDDNQTVAIRRDKSFRSILLVLNTFIVGIIVILYIFYWTLIKEKYWSSKEEKATTINYPNKDPPANTDETLGDSAAVCSTLECKSATARMLSLVNDSVNPCEDFYKFACADNKNADDPELELDLLNEIRKIDNSSHDFLIQYKEFYTKCLNFDYNVG